MKYPGSGAVVPAVARCLFVRRCSLQNAQKSSTPQARRSVCQRRAMKSKFGSISKAVLAVLAIMGGVTVARAQGTCPASPAYSPDFSLGQNCLSLNGSNANFTGSPSFSAPQTTQQSVSNVLRLTANQGGWATSAWFT